MDAIEGMKSATENGCRLTDAIRQMGGTASLGDLYRLIKDTAKAAGNPNWQAKVRQTVRRAGLQRVSPAQYSMGI